MARGESAPTSVRARASLVVRTEALTCTLTCACVQVKRTVSSLVVECAQVEEPFLLSTGESHSHALSAFEFAKWSEHYKAGVQHRKVQPDDGKSCAACNRGVLLVDRPVCACDSCNKILGAGDCMFVGRIPGSANRMQRFCDACNVKHGVTIDHNGPPLFDAVEAFVACAVCMRLVHRACWMGVEILRSTDGATGAVCDSCFSEYRNVKIFDLALPPHSAETLPMDECTSFIHSKMPAGFAGHVRTLFCAAQKETRCKNFASYFGLAEYEFTARTLGLFSLVDGAEILSCVIIVREYGVQSSDAARCSNDMVAYLSYVDTNGWHLPCGVIIDAYVQFVRSKGFRRFMFWACPPQVTKTETDEYLFYNRRNRTRPHTGESLHDYYFEKALRNWVNYRVATIDYAVDKVPYVKGDVFANAWNFDASLKKYANNTKEEVHAAVSRWVLHNTALSKGSAHFMYELQTDEPHVEFSPPQNIELRFDAAISNYSFMAWQYNQQLSFKTLRDARHATVTLVQALHQHVEHCLACGFGVPLNTPKNAEGKVICASCSVFRTSTIA